MKKVLIAGMGNILRRDDGFGVEVARRLARQGMLWPGVKLIEVGIGGIHLVQELMDGYDVLIIIDAVERNSPPGSVHLLDAEVPDLATWSDEERQDFLADMHYTTPSRALILARALGILPPRVFILGCQPAEVEELGIGLSEAVEEASEKAVTALNEILRQLA